MYIPKSVHVHYFSILTLYLLRKLPKHFEVRMKFLIVIIQAAKRPARLDLNTMVVQMCMF